MKKKKSKKLSPAEKLKGITSVIGVKDKAKVVDLTSDKGKGRNILPPFHYFKNAPKAPEILVM